MSESAPRRKEIISEIQKTLARGYQILYHEALEQGRVDEGQAKQLEGSEAHKAYAKSYQSLRVEYQNWYSISLSIVTRMGPDRSAEFVSLYEPDKRRKEVDYLSYTISDYLSGVSVRQFGEEILNPFTSFYTKLDTQLSILGSIAKRASTVLSDIEAVIQAELFDNEIAVAHELLKKKHLRAAGAVAGVVLETHLKKVCADHGVRIRKANPSIGDLNDALKSQSLVDTPQWRLVQRLGDIRNLCVHAKDREPTPDEVGDLVRGCEKTVAELF